MYLMLNIYPFKEYVIFPMWIHDIFKNFLNEYF